MLDVPEGAYAMSRPAGELVVSYGGGVDSVACLIYIRALGAKPKAITMADPGSEKRATMAYVSDWMNPRLKRWGWPQVEVISRAAEGALRPPLPASRGERRLETLRGESRRRGALPSIAYGLKRCSQKYKAEPQKWWTQRQAWAQEEWAAGRKLVRVIGYGFYEPQRVQRGVVALASPAGAWERKRFTVWYPLFEARLLRADEEALIRAERMPLPPKSSCTFCPNNTLEEWKQLRSEEPEAFADAVEMSREAHDNIDNPDDVGLMRCNQSGRRQLHEWADGKYGLGPLFEHIPAVACECST